jgi:hypothetical protein
MRSLPTLLLAGAAALALATPASRAAAQLVADPAGDFLASYVGPRTGDLDVLGANVFFDGATFRSPAGRPARSARRPRAVRLGRRPRRGTARFGPLAPGVLFDAVVVLNPGGTSTVNDLINGTSTALAVGAVAFAGADLGATVSASLLPMLAGGSPSRRTRRTSGPASAPGTTTRSATSRRTTATWP